MLQLPYISYQGVSAEETLLTISNQDVYQYILELMKKNFGFERYILENQVSETTGGANEIRLAVSVDVLEQHLKVVTPETLNKVASN